MKIEIFKDKAGKYRYRIRFSNRRIAATSEAYAKKGNAERAADDLIVAWIQCPAGHPLIVEAKR